MGLLDATLPEGRRWGRVADYFEVTRKPRGLKPADHETVPFVPMEAIPQGGHYEPRYDAKLGAQITSGTYFERGDLLIAKITPSFENGKQAWTKGSPAPFGYATTEVVPLRPTAPNHDTRFLFFYLLHPEIRSYVAERMEGTTGRQRVPEQVLLDVPYPVLPSEDQHVIADSLERIIHQIELERRSAQKAEELKRAAMRELFTRGLRGEPQKETEFGPVPDDWDIVPLDQVAFVQTGVAKGRKLGVGTKTIDVPYLRVANVQDGHLDLSEMKTIRIRSTELDRYLLKDGDVVLTEGGDFDKLGRGFIWTGEVQPCVHQNHVFSVRVDRERLMPAFLAYLVQSAYGKAYFLKVAHKTTNLACINTTKLKALPVLLPALDEQREIVAILDAIDRKIALHREKRRVLEELFKALLHKLMTGEIRVADLDLSALGMEDTASPIEAGAAK
ncbi:MAG: restriction endonuclease subunit S [Gemmataceae bacterium]|nr:restriction endonuclease subunit S [Gemmataceae bacterium]